MRNEPRYSLYKLRAHANGVPREGCTAADYAQMRADLMAPLLQLLGMTEQQLRAAREDGLSVGDIARDLGIAPREVTAAIRSGREAIAGRWPAGQPMPSSI